MKKPVSIIIGLLITCMLPNTMINAERMDLPVDGPSFLLPANDTGILLEAAEFWIGLPSDGSTSPIPLLRIAKGTKLEILDREDDYYRVLHRNLVGYVEKRVVQLQNAVPEDPFPVTVAEELTSKGTETPNAVKKETASRAGSNSGAYRITQPTSLRRSADSQSSVILRFREGDRVNVLDSSGQWWWKVDFNGRTGWAKRALLEKD